GDEARVGAEFLALAQIEPAGPDAEPDRLRGAPLQPDHARGTAARALAEHALFHQDDALPAGLPQEVGAPRPDGPAADPHGVGGVRRPRHWHEPDAGIN